jgi:4-diphosphocytidyl-2-C-methyl-D-erythritol kinase
MSSSRAVRVLAPAKINLALHVTGQRDDGYHLLESLVVFAELGDRLTLTSPGTGILTLGGPFGAALSASEDNLVSRVAARFRGDLRLDFHLDKHLPVASGIGGGSADAAACFRALALLDPGGEPLPPGACSRDALLEIGADVPVCVESRPAILRGIGERLDFLPDFPTLWAVLVNPGAALSTPRVFKALSRKDNPGLSPLPDPLTAEGLTGWLAAQRNDLEQPAIAEQTAIAEVLAALRDMRACTLARMSGSGATCFGLFPRREDAEAAADTLAEDHPRWWVRATSLGGDAAAAPQLIRSTT